MPNTELAKHERDLIQSFADRSEELAQLLRKALALPSEEAEALLSLALHKADDVADDLGLFVGGVKDRGGLV